MKLNYKRTALVGLAFLTINAVWQLYNTDIPIMLERMIRGMAADIPWLRNKVTTVTNAIMSIDNILAVFLLPLLGRMSDKTNTRLGKRTPYIIAGVAFSAISLPFIPLFYGRGSVVGVAIAIGVLLLAMSLYRSPAVALMPDVTPKPLRSEANAIINLMGAAGNILIIIAAFFAGIAFKKGGNNYYTAVFSATAVIIILVLTAFLSTVREPELLAEMPAEEEETEEERAERLGKGVKMQSSKFKSLIFLLVAVAMWYMAYGAIETNFSRYAVDVLGMSDATKALPMLVAMGAALVCFLPLGTLSRKIGRKKCVMLGVGSLCVAALLSSVASFIVMANRGLNVFTTVLFYLLFAVIGISWAAINVNSYPMVVEMSRGADVGKYTGIYYTAQMIAQIATPLLSGVLIDLVRNAFNTDGLVVIFPYGTVFMCLAFVAMLFVKHGEAAPVTEESLAEDTSLAEDSPAEEPSSAPENEN